MRFTEFPVAFGIIIMYINATMNKSPAENSNFSMRNYAVIGDPVGHSRSPGMQNAAFEFHHLGSPYLKIHVRPEELPAFVERARRELAGFNCTVPHKAAIIPFLDEADPKALAAGSVNTVTVKEDGRLIGTSTDGYGLEMALKENFGRPLAGSAVCFIGCGGAAHATAFHLASRGVRVIRLANRTIEKAEELAERLRAENPEIAVETARPDDRETLERWLNDTDFLIQATSLGLRPGDPPPFDLSLLRPGLRLAVFDTIYLETPILKRARETGLPAAGGAAMLLYQGAKSFEIWTGLPAPIEAMRAGMEGKPSCI